MAKRIEHWQTEEGKYLEPKSNENAAKFKNVPSKLAFSFEEREAER